METLLRRRHPPGTRAVILSFICALLASLVLAVLPVYASVSQSASVRHMASGGTATEAPDEIIRTRSETRTLVQTNGADAVLWFLIPVAIAGIAFALNWTTVRQPARVVAAALLMAIVVVTAMSIGVLFAPSAIAMLAAAATGGRADAPNVVGQA